MKPILFAWTVFFFTNSSNVFLVSRNQFLCKITFSRKILHICCILVLVTHFANSKTSGMNMFFTVFWTVATSFLLFYEITDIAKLVLFTAVSTWMVLAKLLKGKTSHKKNFSNQYHGMNLLIQWRNKSIEMSFIK